MRGTLSPWQRLLAEVAESTLLNWVEPNSIQFGEEHEAEVPRVRAAIGRAAGGKKLARFRRLVNRNGFLLGCLDYTERRSVEHLIVGYGVRHGATTKIDSLHHVIGGSGSVAITPVVAHAMWNHYGRDQANEILLFHNHPLNLLNLLIDNLPLASQTDRITLETRALNQPQLLRSILGQGRVLFFLGENGFVKQFRLPSLLSLLERLDPNQKGDGL